MNYKATIEVLGKIYTAEGDNVHHALYNLNVPLGRGKSILTIEHGDEKKERVLGNVVTGRLFSKSPTVRQINLKQVSSMFDL